MDTNQPLIVIVGPTASGKSDLALRVAKQFKGEIICADSRTIYKGMDIGTAKPSSKDQKQIRHHLLDIVQSGQAFSVFDFQRLARIAISETRLRGRIPVMVGGTGLYVDSVIFDYKFPAINNTTDSKLSKLNIEALKKYCYENNIGLPKNENNARHVLSAIRQNNSQSTKSKHPIDNIIIVGITIIKQELLKKIAKRNEHFFENGVVEEAKKLGEMYGWESQAMNGNIYRAVRQMVNGTCNLEETKEKTNTLDWRLAKRQMTWFKRNPYITWLSPSEAETYLFNLLAKARQK